MKAYFIPRLTVAEWRCSIDNCRSLLGMQHDGGLLVVKYKDLHVEIGGEYDVNIKCRRCGATNRLVMTGVHTLIREADGE